MILVACGEKALARSSRRFWSTITPNLHSMAPWDADGIDIYFLNNQDNKQFMNIKTVATVEQIFREISPLGSTPMGKRLNAIIDLYLQELVKCKKKTRGGEAAELPKPMNIIVITDGCSHRTIQKVLFVQAAKEIILVSMQPLWQIGVQFFQVGPRTRLQLCRASIKGSGR